MSEKVNNGEENNCCNECVDKDSVSEKSTKLSDSPLVLVPHSSIYVQSLPQGSVTISQSVTGYSRGGWISGVSSPSQSLQSYFRFPSKRGHFASVYNSEIDLSESQAWTMHNSYSSFGNPPQQSQSNMPERSNSYPPDISAGVSNPDGSSVNPMYASYPYNNMGLYSMCNTPPNSPSMPSNMGYMNRYYPPYCVVSSCGYPLPISAGYNPTGQNFYPPYWMCYSCRKPPE